MWILLLCVYMFGLIQSSFTNAYMYVCIVWIVHVVCHTIAGRLSR